MQITRGKKWEPWWERIRLAMSDSMQINLEAKSGNPGGKGPICRLSTTRVSMLSLI
jgi:hypothetical protein